MADRMRVTSDIIASFTPREAICPAWRRSARGAAAEQRDASPHSGVASRERNDGPANRALPIVARASQRSALGQFLAIVIARITNDRVNVVGASLRSIFN